MKKFISLIPLANVLVVLLTIFHVYFIDMNMNILVLLLVSYAVITSLIIRKKADSYSLLELNWSKDITIIMSFIFTITMIVMILAYQNFDTMGILIGIAIGMLIHLVHHLVTIKENV